MHKIAQVNSMNLLSLFMLSEKAWSEISYAKKKKKPNQNNKIKKKLFNQQNLVKNKISLNLSGFTYLMVSEWCTFAMSLWIKAVVCVCVLY